MHSEKPPDQQGGSATPAPEEREDTTESTPTPRRAIKQRRAAGSQSTQRLTQVIRLEQTDDTAVIRDALRRAQSRRVVLVVPAACHALERDVDLRLVARYAARFGRHVAVVTENRTTWRLARRAGFSTYSTVRQAQAARRWSNRWQPPPRPARPAMLERAVDRSREQRLTPRAGPKQPTTLAERALTLLLFAVLVVALIGGALLVVPSANVTLTPATTKVSARVPVQADPKLERIAYRQGKIPARRMSLTLEGSGDAATTGREGMANARASGRVLFIHRTSMTVDVPRGTEIWASAGNPVKFRTTEDVVVPAGSGQRAMAPIEAVDPGPRGNVPALVINRVEGPLALSLQVVNNEPTSGGDVKQVAVVTNADKDRLRKLLLGRLRQEAINSLREKLEKGEFLPLKTVDVWVEKEVFDHPVDDQAETLHLTLRVGAEALAISDVAAASLARQVLLAHVPQGYRLQEGSVEFKRGPVERRENDMALFTVEVSGTAVAQINAGTVREAVAGRSVAEARKRLVGDFPLAGDPVIQITPGWLRHVPWLSYRVFVHVVEPGATP